MVFVETEFSNRWDQSIKLSPWRAVITKTQKKQSQLFKKVFTKQTNSIALDSRLMLRPERDNQLTSLYLKHKNSLNMIHFYMAIDADRKAEGIYTWNWKIGCLCWEAHVIFLKIWCALQHCKSMINHWVVKPKVTLISLWSLSGIIQMT